MVAVPRQEAPWNGTEKCSGAVSGPYGKEGWDDPFFEGEEAEAVAFCRGTDDSTPCPQLSNCLIFALLNNERDGVWGGHGVEDRKAIRKKWPLRRGRIPRPEWKLFEPGIPSSWFAPEELEEDDDD